MIPQDYITAWSRVAPWVSQRQVEQDLIISRALVAIFSDPFLRGDDRSPSRPDHLQGEAHVGTTYKRALPRKNLARDYPV